MIHCCPLFITRPSSVLTPKLNASLADCLPNGNCRWRRSNSFGGPLRRGRGRVGVRLLGSLLTMLSVLQSFGRESLSGLKTGIEGCATSRLLYRAPFGHYLIDLLRLRPARVWIWYCSEAAEPLGRVQFLDFVEASAQNGVSWACPVCQL